MGLVAAGVAADSAAVAADHMHPVAAARQAEEDRMAVVDRRAVDRRLAAVELRRAVADRTGISARRG